MEGRWESGGEDIMTNYSDNKTGMGMRPLTLSNEAKFSLFEKMVLRSIYGTIRV